MLDPNEASLASVSSDPGLEPGPLPAGAPDLPLDPRDRRAYKRDYLRGYRARKRAERDYAVAEALGAEPDEPLLPQHDPARWRDPCRQLNDPRDPEGELPQLARERMQRILTPGSEETCRPAHSPVGRSWQLILAYLLMDVREAQFACDRFGVMERRPDGELRETAWAVRLRRLRTEIVSFGRAVGSTPPADLAMRRAASGIDRAFRPTFYSPGPPPDAPDPPADEDVPPEGADLAAA